MVFHMRSGVLSVAMPSAAIKYMPNAAIKYILSESSTHEVNTQKPLQLYHVFTPFMHIA